MATVLSTVLTSICGRPAFLRILLAYSSRASSSGSILASESLASSPQLFQVTEDKLAGVKLEKLPTPFDLKYIYIYSGPKPCQHNLRNLVVQAVAVQALFYQLLP